MKRLIVAALCAFVGLTVSAQEPASPVITAPDTEVAVPTSQDATPAPVQNAVPAVPSPDEVTATPVDTAAPVVVDQTAPADIVVDGEAQMIEQPTMMPENVIYAGNGCSGSAPMTYNTGVVGVASDCGCGQTYTAAPAPVYTAAPAPVQGCGGCGNAAVSYDAAPAAPVTYNAAPAATYNAAPAATYAAAPADAGCSSCGTTDYAPAPATYDAGSACSTCDTGCDTGSCEPRQGILSRVRGRVGGLRGRLGSRRNNCNTCY